MTWLPIASAPKDGSLLLLRVTDINARRRHAQAAWPDVTLGYYSERMVQPGWYSLEREDDISPVLEIPVAPTHWMTVPDEEHQGGTQ